MKPADFLRSVQITPERLVAVDFVYPLNEPIDWQQLAAAKPTETLAQESLGIVGTPQPFSLGGFAEERRGSWGVRTTRELALPSGRYQLLVRAATECTLEVDGRVLVDVRPLADNPLAPLPSGLRDYTAQFDADGAKHVFRLTGVARFDTDREEAEGSRRATGCRRRTEDRGHERRDRRLRPDRREDRASSAPGRCSGPTA